MFSKVLMECYLRLEVLWADASVIESMLFVDELDGDYRRWRVKRNGFADPRWILLACQLQSARLRYSRGICSLADRLTDEFERQLVWAWKRRNLTIRRCKRHG
jgi:hypothetical protein